MAGVFFGPPGTAKTTLAKDIASFLGWPLLVVDPSYFVKNGLDRIQAQADRLFELLSSAEEVVVLLDEVDELVRDRANSELRSRFLTTAMLPKLAKINDSRRIVFLVTTNHVDQFDLAIRRPGRFDAVIQVMPPTCEAKLLFAEKEGMTNFVSTVRKGFGPFKSDVRTMLRRLTFGEFKKNLSYFNEAKNRQELRERIKEVERVCTLKVGVSEGGPTWEKVCEKQKPKIQLP